MGFGDFDITIFDASSSPYLAYFLFGIYCCLFAVVMMNLLIAFLSDSFESVQERAPSELMKERASLCVELLQVLPSSWRRAIAYRQVFLFVMTPSTDVGE